ncbi:LuxR C-terminal-related transcriptional regulator [Mesorhizobium sp. B292B1B]|uniref:LuxR C-terminal-related transcriptional regulator n=1 Tax=unclassified Mesorhizobium TaxID=325217 RepID=UPI00112D2FDB|nr:MULTISPECIES: LuxR C-terminal-related transcriptional regulator [unclassified Mesorhizobium]MCA0012226.1 LuxR C-terminal-related transcriptional regulator [Mesorhizobium sp. B294B1A1]MCA0039192.1 LuxR C-terminal-related transcriptional regulator [Mesorhizobium sp. B292B1B]TPM46014.1 LuxR family transcriptional regulator [Mesorhizobium sp. B2-3-2]
MKTPSQPASQASLHHRRWVRRESILSTLDRHVDTRIVLFSAPAGFGKSTTMAQWMAETARLGRLTAWLSCEASDNDEGAFLAHLVGALRHLVQNPAELDLAFQSSPIPQLDVVLAALVAGFAAREADITLFFDDYHAVEAPAVKRFMERLTRQAPANVAFVIGSRSLPDLQLGKLRVLGDVFEIGPDDLRFASSEAEAFFNDKLGLSVSATTVETLCSRAEGWAAGLQLASLSLSAARAPETVIGNFTGASRNVADFLMGEVFGELPPDIAKFLLYSSIFERFCADACRAVMRAADAEAAITEIETRNLFLVPLDDERRWFRYHHLFRDFLSREMERREPEMIAPLHLAASEWFGERKMLTEAIGHALAAGDQARAAVFVENNALDLIAQCQLLYVRQLLALLPKKLIDQRIRLQLVVLWLAVHSSQPEIAKQTLASSRKLVESGPADGKDPGTLAGTTIEAELAVLDAAVHSTLEQFEDARDTALAALRIIAPDAWFMEGATANVIGYNLYALGDLDGARAAIDAARLAHERSGSLLGVTIANCYMAVIERSAGRLPAAERLLRNAIIEARARIGANSYAEALAGTLLAELAYETNSSGEALALVENLGPLIEGAAVIVYPLASVPTYARVLQLTGRPEAALDMLDRVYQRVRGTVYRRLASMVLHDRIRMLLDQNRNAEARALLTEHRGDAVAPMAITTANEFEFFAEGRLLTAEKAHAEAAGIFDALLARTGSGGRIRRHILALILRAKTASASHDMREADRYLLDALRLARPSGFIRSFVDEGKLVIEGLMRLRAAQAKSDPALSAYATRIIDAAQTMPLGTRKPAAPAAEKEQLTQRESELLHCLTEGMSNRDIAVALSVSETTVKWHLKNIFGKLAVTNRVQAVRAAQAADRRHTPPKGGG